MAFWLAQQRKGQDSDHIQRFDPRFWTVNFPRPMMASVITPAPDALRVDCEFHHAGELAGLIWDSVDTLDHPLLAYETRRDYARLTLAFRWRSGGVIALDQINGPTLTIEGRDAAGAARRWYVRLWNYATGSGTDAAIVLPFSALEGGWTGGDPVYPTDIDRLFISIAPPGYVPDGTEPLPARTDGWVELSEISSDGAGAMLAIGDVLLPPHDVGLATAYDDSFNQTPARLLRNLTGLGYRGRLIHYVGMSHFFRLVPEAGGLTVERSGHLCGPAEAWHRAFFTECADADFQPIVSLSYEVLAEHCPDPWQQRAFDGDPARTGWVPPSALLSPANDTAMGWLQSVAAGFVRLLRDAGLQVLFQIGEPWWWVMPDGRPCLYDAAARAALNDPPDIGTLRDTLTPAETDLLDAAGTILAASTLNLRDAVRAAAGVDGAEVSLLAFTPTVLAADMPEMRRANLPLEWAWPAFDRLQLEDYDWLTAGADALRRAAWDTVDARLGYPLKRQDYLAGFVLAAADAETFWRRIDGGLAAAERGVARRYIWALPQVVRDGYTRLCPQEEETMQAFDDVLYPLALGRDAGVSPEFSTSVAVTASGHERRGSLWSDARLRFDVGPGIRAEHEFGTLIAFFRARRGAARGFRLADPFDHSSHAMTGTPTMLDQDIGVGDGLCADFALIKRYGGDGDPQIRPITRPRVETLLISVDGIATADFTLRPGGIVRLGIAPPAGAVIRAGFLFDVPVRFAEDRLDITGAAFAAGEAPSVPLIEVREAA